MGRTPTTRSSRQTKISGEINTGYGGGYEDGEAQDIEEEKSARIDVEWEGGDKSNRNKAPEKSPISRPGGIDLNKSADIDLEKPKPPRSGGFGIDLGKSPKNNTNVGLDIPIPSVPGLSARGGVSIDPKTGKIRGGYGGAGFGKGPISGSLDAGLDDGGCYHYITISVGPFSHTWGENKCKEKEKQTSSAPSTPTSGQGSPEDQSWNAEGPLPTFRSGCRYKVWFLIERNEHLYANCTGYAQFGGCTGYQFTSFSFNSLPGKLYLKAPTKVWWPSTNEWLYYMNIGGILGALYVCGPRSGGLACTQGADFSQNAPGGFPGVIGIGQDAHIQVPESYGTTFYDNVLGSQVSSLISERVSFYKSFGSYTNIRVFIVEYTCTPPLIPRNELLPDYGSGGTSTPTKSPPIPNYPPTKKKKMDECCLITAAYLQRILQILGQPLGDDGAIIDSPDFFPLEIERIKTPKDPMNPGDYIKERYGNYYQILTYMLNQQIALDVALDPQGYSLPTGEVMNPEYERPSDISLTNNAQPDKDKKGRSRELSIGKQVFIPSALSEMRYLFDALRRLEYLFPYGELADAKIAKHLLIPSAKKEETLKIFNLIHAYEIQMQYLDAIIGDPREQIYLKDVDPSKPGNQEFKFSHLSLSHMVKELFKFQLDTNGDVDMIKEAAIRDLRTNLATRITTVQIAEMVTALFEDSGMLEEQKWLKVPLEGDPYAGHWKAGEGFQPSEKLDSKKEEDIEELARATLQNYTATVKVSKRSPREKTDMRDLLRGLADFMTRLFAVPAANLDSLIENAKFKVQADMALMRAQVTKAASAARSRTRKKGK